MIQKVTLENGRSTWGDISNPEVVKDIEERFNSKIVLVDGTKYNTGGKAGKGIKVEAYDEEKYPSERDYLKTLITKHFGPMNIHYTSADWGGIPNWTIKGDKYEGTFIIIDDNNHVVLMTRQFDAETEENLDNDLDEAEPNDTKALEILFERAMAIKEGKSGFGSLVKKIIKPGLKKSAEFGKKGLQKTREYADKKIHDTKKNIALDVIYETKEDLATGITENKAMETAFNVVESKYKNGGYVKDDQGNYKNAQGFELINQFDGTYQVLDKDGMDISGEYLTLKDAKQTIKDYESFPDMAKHGAKTGNNYGTLVKEIEIVALSQSGTRGYSIFDTNTNRRAINTDGSYEFDDNEIEQIIGTKNMNAFYEGQSKFKPKSKLNFDVFAKHGTKTSNENKEEIPELWYGVLNSGNQLVYETKNKEEAQRISHNHEGSIVKTYSKKRSVGEPKYKIVYLDGSPFNNENYTKEGLIEYANTLSYYERMDNDEPELTTFAEAKKYITMEGDTKIVQMASEGALISEDSFLITGSSPRPKIVTKSYILKNWDLNETDNYGETSLKEFMEDSEPGDIFSIQFANGTEYLENIGPYYSKKYKTGGVFDGTEEPLYLDENEDMPMLHNAVLIPTSKNKSSDFYVSWLIEGNDYVVDWFGDEATGSHSWHKTYAQAKKHFNSVIEYIKRTYDIKEVKMDVPEAQFLINN